MKQEKTVNNSQATYNRGQSEVKKDTKNNDFSCEIRTKCPWKRSSWQMRIEQGRQTVKNTGRQSFTNNNNPKTNKRQKYTKTERQRLQYNTAAIYWYKKRKFKYTTNFYSTTFSELKKSCSSFILYSLYTNGHDILDTQHKEVEQQFVTFIFLPFSYYFCILPLAWISPGRLQMHHPPLVQG